MKRSTLLSLLAAATLTLSPALGAESAREKAGYKGPVKVITLHEVSEDYPRRPRRIIEYDAKGNLTRFTAFMYSYSDGSLRRKLVTTYDENRKAVGREILKPDGSPDGRVVNKYNGEGLRIEEITYDAGGTVKSSQKFEYKDGKEAVKEVYRSGKLRYRYETAYDGSGNPTTRKRLDEAGTVTQKRTYTDANGSFEEVRYKKDGSQQSRGSSKIDERGNMVESIRYAADGSVDNLSTREYDDNGLLVKQTFKKAGRTIYNFYEYTFDSHGNWIKRVESEDRGTGKRHIQTQEREIQFY